MKFIHVGLDGCGDLVAVGTKSFTDLPHFFSIEPVLSIDPIGSIEYNVGWTTFAQHTFRGKRLGVSGPAYQNVRLVHIPVPAEPDGIIVVPPVCGGSGDGWLCDSLGYVVRRRHKNGSLNDPYHELLLSPLPRRIYDSDAEECPPFAEITVPADYRGQDRFTCPTYGDYFPARHEFCEA